MKQIQEEIRVVHTLKGVLQLRYELLAREKDHIVRYGVRVTDELSGEKAEICDVTADSRRAAEFFSRIIRGHVTPITLREVAEDFAAEPEKASNGGGLLG